MADRFYGVNRGGVKKDITEAASTTSLDVEVRFEILAGQSRQEIIDALEYIRQYIMEDTWPPA